MFPNFMAEWSEKWVPKILSQMEIEMKSRSALVVVYDELVGYGQFNYSYR